jgi:hypothetical protein
MISSVKLILVLISGRTPNYFPADNNLNAPGFGALTMRG